MPKCKQASYCLDYTPFLIVGLYIIFILHQNVFAVVNEIRDPTQERIDTVSFSSISTSAIIYGTVALAGFYTYGDAVDSNILVSYPSKGLLCLVNYICYNIFLLLIL